MVAAVGDYVWGWVCGDSGVVSPVLLRALALRALALRALVPRTILGAL